MYAAQYFNNNTDLIQLSLDRITTKDLEYDNFQPRNDNISLPNASCLCVCLLWADVP